MQSWRAQSAEAREKAEQERLKWEAIRAIERQEAAKRKAAGIAEPTPGVLQPKAEVETKSEIWESVAELSTAGSEVTKSEKFGQVSSSSPIRVSICSGNVSWLKCIIQAASTVSDSFPKVLPRTDSQLETATNESQKWEDVPSVASSFPSMSFPEHIESPPSQPPAAPQRPTGSVTLAIFDSSLSPRTRLTALFSSLAINLFLPFVNGVMLGFGEIFAKNIVMGWFGWKPSGPASTTTNVGLRGSREERQRQSR